MYAVVKILRWHIQLVIDLRFSRIVVYAWILYWTPQWGRVLVILKRLYYRFVVLSATSSFLWMRILLFIFLARYAVWSNCSMNDMLYYVCLSWIQIWKLLKFWWIFAEISNKSNVNRWFRLLNSNDDAELWACQNLSAACIRLATFSFSLSLFVFMRFILWWCMFTFEIWRN